MADMFSVVPGKGSSALAKGSAEYFPDPFCDIASTAMPSSIRDVHYWAEYIWLTNGTYRMAAGRIVRYFLTQIEFADGSDDEMQKYDEFMTNTLGIMDYLATLGDDFMCYGNSLSSLYVPFTRYLYCPKCGELELPLEEMDKHPQFRLEFKDFKFHANCPKCQYRGEWTRKDRRSTDEEKLRVIRWSPHDIEMLWHPISHEMSYLWRIPQDLKQEIQRGRIFYLKDVPWEIVEAIQKDELFRFHPGIIYHMKEPTLAGVRNRGWGISRVMTNFKQAWYVQVLKRFNEAIALDYIIPFRVMTPESHSREADPILHTNLGNHKSAIQSMLKEHRRDPATYHVLPFPIKYQILGGEANQLAPVDLLTQGQDELLNGIGTPVELYKGTLQLQAAPTAIRLFQATWPHILSSFNGYLRWLLAGISVALNWEEVTAHMQTPTLADDLERRMIQMQLASAQQISLGTAFKSLGIDPFEEIDKSYEERRYKDEAERKYQESMMDKEEGMQAMTPPPMMGMGGAPMGPMPPGGMAAPMGMPMGGGGRDMSTPADLLIKAEEIANQLIQMPETARKSQLISLKRSNDTLHALVKAKLEELRQGARSQGYQQMMSQMQGGGGMMM